ncbi:MAG: NAD-dependent epimerase/dehydratase family protein [Planctomycetota bacterium]
MTETAADIVRQDLDSICTTLTPELGRIAGKRLLITGGAGFLGYYLVQTVTRWNELARTAPIELTVIDNFIRGAPPWLTALEQAGAFRLLRHDMARPLPANLEQFAYVIHAAGIASPTYYRTYPIETMDANINGLRNLLEHARAGQQLEGFLFYSSSEIYGDPDPHSIPTPETYRGFVSCTGPRACYDEAKRFGETLCVNFFRQHGLPVKAARPFNNYGPGLKITDGRVIPDFARDIFAGRDIQMLSDGSATRTFCYVADAVCGYLKILVRGRPGEAYNIGVETPEIAMRDLAQKLVLLARGLFGYQGKVVLARSQDRDYLIDNPNRRCPLITKARSELDYQPQVSLDEGLRRTLVWYSGNRAGTEA